MSACCTQGTLSTLAICRRVAIGGRPVRAGRSANSGTRYNNYAVVILTRRIVALRHDGLQPSVLYELYTQSGCEQGTNILHY